MDFVVYNFYLYFFFIFCVRLWANKYLSQKYKKLHNQFEILAWIIYRISKRLVFFFIGKTDIAQLH